MPPPVSGSAPRTPTSLSMRDVPEAPAKKQVDLKVHPKEVDTFDATPPARGGVQHVDGKLSPKAAYADLPSDLKSKMSEKVWMALPEGQRSTLLASYQNFKRAGVWDEVSKVTGEKEARERPVKLPGCNCQTHVAGNSGGIQYELKDPKKFVTKLQQLNPQFGVDGGFMGALHPGQKSIRESGEQSTSFHISVGPGNKMDAHIDQVNPVNAPDAQGNTVMNPQGGVEHWSKEVLPEKIRKTLGIPGVIVAPIAKPGSREGKYDVGITVGIELRGLEKTKPRIVNERPAGSYAVPQQVIQKLQTDPELQKMKIASPKGVDAPPQANELAVDLARRFQEALENGQTRITIDLPNYAGQKGYQTAATADISRVAKKVLAEMKAAGVDVTSLTALTVTYGKRNANDRHATEGETISLR